MPSRFINGLSRNLHLLENAFGALALGTIVAITLIQVFFRYFLGSALEWSAELTKVTFIWMTFFAAPAAIGARRHLRVDSFVSLLPKRGQIALSVVAHIIMIILSWYFLRYGLEVSDRVSGTRIPSLDISRSVIVLPLAIGGGLMLLSSIGNIIQDISSLKKGKSR